jgi:UMF1 family MFS transporter
LPGIYGGIVVQNLRKRIWGWMMYDWASQPYFTLGLTFIFGPYFGEVAVAYFIDTGSTLDAAKANAQSLWAWSMGAFGILIALLAPLLGALADASHRRLPLIKLFSLVYVIGAAGLWVLVPDAGFYTLLVVLFLFGMATIGAEFTTIFTNAILVDLGSEEQIGKLSGTGYAVGYWGGVTALFIMLLFFIEQANGVTRLGIAPLFGLEAEAKEGTRFVGPFIAIWYIIFMVPFFAWVHEPTPITRPAMRNLLAETWASVRFAFRQPSLRSYLLASMLYRDALTGLFAFGGIYAVFILGWPIAQIGVFGIIAAICAAIFAWFGGRLDSMFGPKPVIVSMVIILLVSCTNIVGMSRDSWFGVPFPVGSHLPDIIFFVLGAVNGSAGGILLAASRTMMVRHSDPLKPAEGFGLYALAGKATAFLAPGLIGLATYVLADARLGFTPVIGLFLLSLVLLSWVKPEGERQSWT